MMLRLLLSMWSQGSSPSVSSVSPACCSAPADASFAALFEASSPQAQIQPIIRVGGNTMRVRTIRPALIDSVALAVSLLLLITASTSAHQRQLIQIGATDYLVVVGFVNEPVYTGDKSGVELIIITPDPANPLDSRAPEAKPVEALEKSLKVEVKAGPHTKVFDLQP